MQEMLKMQTKQQANPAERDSWQRNEWILSLIFVTSILLPFAILTMRSDRLDGSLPTQGMIVALLLVIHLIVYRKWLPTIDTGQTGLTQRELVMMLLYFVVMLVLWAILVFYNMSYLFGLAGFVPMINRWLPPVWAITLMGCTFAINTAYIVSGSWRGLFAPSWSMLLWFSAMFIPAFLTRIWISGIVNQSLERRNLIEKLTATQTELLQAEHRTGILEERQRLAREIHDTLAQGFTSIVMHLEAAEQAADHSRETFNPATQKHLDRARSTARGSLEQSRRVIANLRPKPLAESRTFADGVQRVVDNWSAMNDVTARFKATGAAVVLQPEAELVLLRVVQEALNNIRKHADATQVNVTLSFMDDIVMLDIQDDGVGIDAAAAPSGYGLTAMHERLQIVAGTLEIESAPARGTTVVVTIPLQQ